MLIALHRHLVTQRLVAEFSPVESDKQPPLSNAAGTRPKVWDQDRGRHETSLVIRPRSPTPRRIRSRSIMYGLLQFACWLLY